MSNAEAAFAARCLLRVARVATLATQHGGQPFASLVTPAATTDGHVVLLLSALSAHTRHLAAEPRCALLVCGAAEDANPQTAPRLTLTGRAAIEGGMAWRRHWLARHPYAAHYAGFADFSLWRIVPEAGHYVGGFARASTLAPADLAARPLLEAEAGALAQFNALHGPALSRLALQAGHAGEWRMTALDTDGLDLAQGDAVVRIALDRPVADVAGARAAIARLLGREGAEQEGRGQ